MGTGKMEKEQTCAVVIDENMRISRGEKPDVVLDFSQIENMPVWDEYRQNIRFGDLYKDQRTIVIFIRHFLCYISKEYIDDLAKVPMRNVSAAGVRIVIIGCGQSKFVEPFRKLTGCPYEVFVDPACHIHKKFNLIQGVNPAIKAKESKHVKSGVVMGVLKSTWRSMYYREFQGDTRQQGGAFILGPGNQIHHQHIEQTPTDHIPINDLLGMTGIPQVNFEKDKRVLSL